MGIPAARKRADPPVHETQVALVRKKWIGKGANMHITADREGKILKEHSAQDCLLELMYGNAVGRMLLKPLVTPAASKLGGMLLGTKASALAVPLFIRLHHVRMEDFEQRKFVSYNDFFTRKLAPGARIADQEKEAFISPCDSRLRVYKIDSGRRFCIKQSEYTVEGLLRNRRLAQKFAGGYAWIFRLSVDDYHRYIYTDNGKVSTGRRIQGVFHTVSPASEDAYAVYKENTREYCLLQSENFGTVLIMEVGALLVGKIENRPGGREVVRGEEKGNFAFGGSTVILLTQQGKVLPSGDILRYSRSGIETKVKLGERVGMKNITKRFGIKS